MVQSDVLCFDLFTDCSVRKEAIATERRTADRTNALMEQNRSLAERLEDVQLKAEVLFFA